MFDLKDPEKIFTLAIVGLISLIVGTQIITVLSVKDRSDETRIINLAGRQRMLSQVILKKAYEIQDYEDELLINSLKEDARLWNRVQNGLEFGDENLQLNPETFESVDSLFIAMRPYHEVMYNAVIGLGDIEEIDGILQTLKENEPEYLELMDAAIFAFENESEENNAKTATYKLILFFIILLITGGLGFIFIRPLSKKIKTELSSEVLEAKKHFKTLFEDSGIGIAFVNPEGKLFRINNFFCELLGYSEEEMLSMTFPEFTHPDDLEKDWDLFTEMVEGDRNYYQIDKRYYHKNGNIIWVTLSVSKVIDEEGGLDYVIAMIQDITEEKKFAADIVDFEKIIEISKEISGIIPWIIDFENNDEIYGQELLDFYEIKERPENLTKDVLNLVHKDDVEKVKQAFYEADKRKTHGKLNIEWSLSQVKKIMFFQ